MSAPSSSGRWRYGVANVLSTTVIAPATAASRADRADVDDLESAGSSASRSRPCAAADRPRTPLRPRRGRGGQPHRSGSRSGARPCRPVATSRRRRRRSSAAGRRGRADRARPASPPGPMRTRCPCVAALERRDGASSASGVGIPAAAVLEAAAEVADAVLLERHAHLDRGTTAPVSRVGLRAGMHGERLESIGHGSLILSCPEIEEARRRTGEPPGSVLGCRVERHGSTFSMITSLRPTSTPSLVRISRFPNRTRSSPGDAWR